MNKTEIFYSLEQYDELSYIIIYDFIRPIISVLSFLSNLICALVFYEIIKVFRQNDNKMFHYLFLKSVCDMFNGLIEAFYPLYGIDSLSTSTSYLIAIWYIYFHKYMGKVFLLASGFLEIVATFDCAIAMENSMKWFQRWASFILINVLIFVFSFIYNIYIVLAYKITKIGLSLSNRTVVEYHKKANHFYDSKEYYYLHLINSILRDVVVIVLLFIINLYILINLKKIRERKDRLQKKTKISKMIKSIAYRAENRKLKMIYALCLIYIFGHSPSILYNLKVIKNNSFQVIFHAFGDVIYYISYGTPIIVYYCFNNNFKSILKKKILRQRDV
jgi:hypothetical protein